MDLLVGIDIGTSGCKITLINLDGEIIAEASREYTTYHPKPFFSEQNPSDWFKAMKDCLYEINRYSGQSGLQNIKAVSLDGSTHNAVLLDNKMNVVRPTIMWNDQRSKSEAEYLENGWGPEIFKIGFQKVTPTWTLPQLLWIKNNEPENFKRIHKIMFVKDYMRYLLTNSWETDYIDAQGSLLYDIRGNKWSNELCSLIDLPVSVLPPLCQPSDITGKVTENAEAETGLPAGIPVICGTSDVIIEDYASGANHPGQCILKLATAGNVNLITEKPRPDPLTLTYSNVIPGTWLTIVATSSAASAMRWFRDVFCVEETNEAVKTGKNIYQIMAQKADSINPGSDGLIFHPYLMGERSPYWDPSLRASFTGATMAHTKGHFIRALMEGVGFSLRDCYGIIEKMKLEVTELIIIGGGAKSDTWSRIICDIFGKPVVRPAVTDASYGSALLAGVGAGYFPDITETVRRCVKMDKIFAPDPDNHIIYCNMFRQYLQIHDNLADIYKGINNKLTVKEIVL